MTADPPPAGFQSLTAPERRVLLWLARASIRTALQRQDPPELDDPTPALSAPTAAFVSLHCGRRLRGCIGTLAADSALHHTVAQLARSAAFDDPRFPPLAANELPAVGIEISRLSPLVPTQPEHIRLGVHGISITCGDRRGVFLPQVALQHDWNRDRLLAELCQKAMLPADAWTRPDCVLMAFEAEVFGESATA
jgi:AmmeMemoRadiSam system protein A